MGTRTLSSLVIGLVAGASGSTSSAQNCEGRAFTTTAEFAAGQHQGYSVEWFNVQDTGHELEIASPPGAMFPYVNVACSARGTVVRIYVGSGDSPETRTPYVVGEYWTFPSTGHAADNLSHGNPSRTTADRNGATWVANRAEAGNWGDPPQPMGSITRIALATWDPDDAGEVIDHDDADSVYLKESAYPSKLYLSVSFDELDRNDDHLIRTSKGLGHILPWTSGDATSAVDELIMDYVRVDGTNARTMAIDYDNNLWVGGYTNHKHEQVDGQTGAVISGSLFEPACGGYGGLVDHSGILWSAQYDQYSNGPLLRYEPALKATPEYAIQCLTTVPGHYGLAIDPLTGHIWASGNPGTNACEIAPGTGDVLQINGQSCCYEQGFLYAQGIAVDGRGHVWIAEAHGTRVRHLAPDPTPGNESLYYPVTADDGATQYVTGFSSCTGVAVDKNGRIWVSEEGLTDQTGWASRIDPDPAAQAPDAHGNKLGVREASTAIALGTDARPYNYSDMTGFVAQQPLWQGRWTVIHDGGVPNGRWNRLRWNTETCDTQPQYTNIIARVRAADSQDAFAPEYSPPLPWREVKNGECLCWLRGQYIQVEMDLKGNNAFSDGFRSPVLCDVSIDSFDENDPGAWVVYVDKDAQGANTGASWADAFTEP